MQMGELRLIEQFVNRLQARVEAALIALVGSDTDSDQTTVGVKQSATGAALDWHVSAFDVVRAEVTIEGSDTMLSLRRGITSAASDTEDVLVFGRGGREPRHGSSR